MPRLRSARASPCRRESAAAHLLRVLRLGVGDACVLFNGDGRDYEARIVAATKKAAEAQIVSAREVANESPLRITLAQALARGEKMDWILQKATELGVAAIAPILTERTEVRLGGERVDRRLARWRGVVAAACEQCGRARLPEVCDPRPLADWIALPPRARRLALDPDGELAARTLPLPGNAPVVLAIGPEGGFSECDLSALRAAGFRGLRLGPRVLRTETAGLAAIAALQALHGDLGGLPIPIGSAST